MSFYTAKRQFEDNIKLFSGPNMNDEKFNLYNGLANLAGALYNLENKIRTVEDDIRRIKNKT